MKRLLLCLCMASALGMGAAIQPPAGGGGGVGGGGSGSERPALPSTVVGLEARLKTLKPSDPLAYFVLAEDLAAEAADKPSRDLARRLFVLSFELYIGRNGPGDGEMARSATLGLASLTSVDSERRWLAAVGDQVAPASDKTAAATARLPAAVPEQTALNLATAMGLARAGEGRRADQYLNREGVRDLLATTGAAVSGAQSTAGMVQKWIEEWPVCPTCKNRRVVTRGNETNLCPYCDGNPGPKLNDATLLSQFRAESNLLRGAYRSWSAQLLADDGEPLRDPNPTDVAVMFGVDPRATLWVDGAWIAPAAPPAAPAKPAPAAPPTPSAAPPDAEAAPSPR